MADDLTDQRGRLVDDAYVAKLLSMSRSFIRKQRFLRRRGLPHVFDIDPVLIGATGIKTALRIPTFMGPLHPVAWAGRRRPAGPVA